MADTLREMEERPVTAPMTSPATFVSRIRTHSRAASPPSARADVPKKLRPGLDYELLRYADRWVPGVLFGSLKRIGAAVAMFAMRNERRHSSEYLTVVLGRPPRIMEIWRHFHAYAETFVLRMQLAEGKAHRCEPLPCCDALKVVLSSQRPALLGTFHFGNSDLLGFLLSEFGGHVHMIRLRMERSRDTHRLEHRFGKAVSFIWVNDVSNLLFAVKHAAQSGSSIALKCDRPEYSSKLEAFEFLGKRRLFPFTIYHLAILFQLPVVFCVAVPARADASRLHGSPVFEPDGGSKEENFARARAHFQQALTQLEELIRLDPYQWFNFTPLISEVSAGGR